MGVRRNLNKDTDKDDATLSSTTRSQAASRSRPTKQSPPTSRSRPTTRARTATPPKCYSSSNTQTFRSTENATVPRTPKRSAVQKQKGRLVRPNSVTNRNRDSKSKSQSSGHSKKAHASVDGDVSEDERVSGDDHASDDESVAAKSATRCKDVCSCGRDCFTWATLEGLLKAGSPMGNELSKGNESSALDFNEDDDDLTEASMIVRIGQCKTMALRARWIMGKSYKFLKGNRTGDPWTSYLKQRKLDGRSTVAAAMAWYELYVKFPHLERLPCNWSDVKKLMGRLTNFIRVHPRVMTQWEK
jgi:hypothetical protein